MLLDSNTSATVAWARLPHRPVTTPGRRHRARELTARPFCRPRCLHVRGSTCFRIHPRYTATGALRRDGGPSAVRVAIWRPDGAPVPACRSLAGEPDAA